MAITIGLARGRGGYPTKSGPQAPHSYDVIAYRGATCRLQDFRRIATRYDKLARNFLAGVLISQL